MDGTLKNLPTPIKYCSGYCTPLPRPSEQRHGGKKVNISFTTSMLRWLGGLVGAVPCRHQKASTQTCIFNNLIMNST